MTLGGGAPDAATIAAIADARAQGSLSIIAAGNDDRQDVSFPASDPLAVAVAALGRIGTFPATSVEAGMWSPRSAPIARTSSPLFPTWGRRWISWGLA